MPVELDHVYVWVSIGGAEAGRLAALGLSEGQPNRHSGQGTACRRFFFSNAYLELLWVENPEEAQGKVAGPLRLWERWSGRGVTASPFGVILQPAQDGSSEPPFPAWEFRPPYLPPPLVLYVGENVECLEEPVFLYLTPHRGATEPVLRNGQPLDHKIGIRELTAVRIFGPHLVSSSTVMKSAEETGAVVFRHASEHSAEIGFDGETQGQRADLRPDLPLVLCW